MDKTPTKYQRMIGAIMAQGWNQGQIAEALGVHSSQIHKLRTGQTRDPLASTAEKLAGLHRSVVNGGKQ